MILACRLADHRYLSCFSLWQLDSVLLPGGQACEREWVEGPRKPGFSISSSLLSLKSSRVGTCIHCTLSGSSSKSQAMGMYNSNNSRHKAGHWGCSGPAPPGHAPPWWVHHPFLQCSHQSRALKLCFKYSERSLFS